MVENRTINDEIITMIQYEIRKIPSPTRCTIIKIYNDKHVDINTKKYGTLNYIEAYGAYSIGDKGILVFLDNDFEDMVVITDIGEK